MKRTIPWQVAVLQPKTWRELMALMRGFRAGVVFPGEEKALKILDRK